MLVNLESLTIHFQSSISHPDRERRHPPPQIRTVLSSLTDFEFRGVTDYLEDLVARIDAPLLDSVCITLVHKETSKVSQLGEFMKRTRRFQALNEAHVDFDPEGVTVSSIHRYRPLTKSPGSESQADICHGSFHL
jgi:hypothetical protein